MIFSKLFFQFVQVSTDIFFLCRKYSRGLPCTALSANQANSRTFILIAGYHARHTLKGVVKKTTPSLFVYFFTNYLDILRLVGVQPPADILNKMAEILNTSVDYLINGNTDEKAQATLKNAELLQRFKEIENLPEHEQTVLLEVISAYIRDFKAKQSFGLTA